MRQRALTLFYHAPFGKILGAILLLLLPVATSAVEEVSVAALFKDKALVEIDGKRRLLSAGETSPEGVKLIRANSKEAVLEINGIQRVHTLGNRIGTRFDKPERASLQLWPNRSGFYLVDGQINGVSIKMLVDTGASHVSMNAPAAQLIGLEVDEERVGLSSTAGGYSKVYPVTLKNVKVGSIEKRNVQALVHEGNFPEVVLLGNSFLGKLDLRREGEMLELIDK